MIKRIYLFALLQVFMGMLAAKEKDPVDYVNTLQGTKCYIQSSTLNNKTYNHNWVRYSDIVNGGKLVFDMAAVPALQRGISEADKPFSLSKTSINSN